VPAEAPKTLIAAGGLCLLVALITGMTPQLSRSWVVSVPVGSIAGQAPGDLRSSLEGAPADPEARKLDRALQVLENAAVSDEERRQAVAQARDAIEQVDMEASAARESLARLADTLKSDPRFGRLAEAMQQGRVDEAQALLRQMQAEAATASSQEKDVGTADRGVEPNPDPAIEQTGRTLRGVNDKINQDTMDKMLRAVEKARERFELQKNVNAVRRRMEDHMAAASRQEARSANEFGRNISAPNPTPSPETGNSEMPGGTMFREKAPDQGGEDPDRDGSRTGSPSGHAESLPVEGAATRRLEAQLKREIIQRRGEEDGDTEKGGRNWFFAPSGEQKSELQFEAVRARSAFDGEDAMGREAVPLGQKRIVKDYFLNLHESESK
jgi:hypothetical protein